MRKWKKCEVKRMERLTKWEGKTEEGEVRAAFAKRDGAFIGLFLEAMKKLAQYEDTGLEPWEVRNGEHND